MTDILKKYEDFDFVATEDDVNDIINNSKCESKPTLESSPPATNQTLTSESVVVIDEKSDHLETDYNYIRNNLYTITEKSIDALNTLVDIAEQSQHPRAYEVISLMVNTIASAQKDLMTIHKDKKKLEIESGNSEKSEVVNNNLFIGNTAQLDEIIANMTKKKSIE